MWSCQLLSITEVSTDESTFIIQQHILRFEVPVDDSLLVEVLQTLNYLGHVVAGPWLLKAWVVFIHIVNVIPGCRRGTPEYDQMCWTNKRQKVKYGCIWAITSCLLHSWWSWPDTTLILSGRRKPGRQWTCCELEPGSSSPPSPPTGQDGRYQDIALHTVGIYVFHCRKKMQVYTSHFCTCFREAGRLGTPLLGRSIYKHDRIKLII